MDFWNEIFMIWRQRVFLTNDIQSFKAQLVELTTHDLITTKKEKDGKKIYGTTLDTQTVHNLLKQFKNA